MQASVQDTGRFGHRSEGVSTSGAMDIPALRIGNILAGNDEAAAAIECTLHGLELEFTDDRVVALTGGGSIARLEGEDVQYWKPFVVRAGNKLSLHATDSGCRTYVAIAGGVDVPVVLGSRSTLMRAGIGGYHGRALREGDLLPLGSISDQSAAILRHLSDAGAHSARWGAGASVRPRYSQAPSVRFVPGGMSPLLDVESRNALSGEWFTVSARSDRMGIRLEGHAIRLREPREVLSAPVSAGTMQLPPDGIPIILVADGQTTGGYPRLGEVASVDLALLAQLRPGDRVRFTAVPVEEAVRAWRDQEQELGDLRAGLQIRLRYQP
jgi:antagonist of KipI